MKDKTPIAPRDVVPAISDLRLSGAGDLRPTVVAPVGKLHEKKEEKSNAEKTTQVSPASNKNNDLPTRRRSFKNYSYLDPSHPDAEENCGIGYQPTMVIPQYDDKAYDPSISCPILFVHSSTYD